VTDLFFCNQLDFIFSHGIAYMPGIHFPQENQCFLRSIVNQYVPIYDSI